ncbi:hypothetical protein OIO90_006546 [Microbotryomycetes sp. JL221]|nr:hypothetical protein OIO90_006546 [Microbotryomycetes sp. JL221]
MTGCIILWLKSRQEPRHGSFYTRLRPSSPFIAYASVAFLNFLSTTCQYESLKYVSFTTQSLAKTSKMIPVLIVGAAVWKQQHKPREWIAGAVILLGCTTYLFSGEPTSAPASVDSHHFVTAVAGTACLVGYLFFDGLVSTTQEKVFGRNTSSADPFSPESPVLDQMIWTNLFAGLIAGAVATLSNTTGTLLPNIHLLLTSPSLVWDVMVFSAASAVGLIVLLNTIASFGALTSSVIMTIRQFLSILINAGAFGNFAAVSVQGWLGVGWVASGLWIKTNRKYDDPKASATSHELEVLVNQDTAASPSAAHVRSSTKTYVRQYLMPLLLPVALALAAAPFFTPTSTMTGRAAEALISMKGRLSSLAPNHLQGSNQGDRNNADPMSANEVEAQRMQGGRWDDELHAAVAPNCSSSVQTVPYKGSTNTGFVSFPRSGNSYLRSLVERATGYQTSSVSIPRVYTAENADYYKRFDQVVHLIRNPLDSIASWYHLSNAPKSPEGNFDHEAKIDLPGGKFSELQRSEVTDMAERWGRHALYWNQAPVLSYRLRYEDLRTAPIPNPAIIPAARRGPAISEAACMHSGIQQRSSALPL